MLNVKALPSDYSQSDLREIENLEALLSIASERSFLVGPEGDQIPLPEPLYHLLREIVEALSKGKGVSIIPQEQELTTQEAADCLNVSRPYLIKLLDSGEIPCKIVGKRHRRVLASDLLEYKARRDEERRKYLDEMTLFLQDEGFYDE